MKYCYKICYLCWRNCIIDKNAKIGKDVIIANKDVSNDPVWLMPVCKTYHKHNLFMSYQLISFLCRAFKKQIDQKMDSTFDQESPS